MYVIRYRGVVAQQDNKTNEIKVEGQGYPEKVYTEYGKLSGKELRTVVERYLRENGWEKEVKDDG